ncbi:uncharacterized protein J3D65DRAFT_402593 [Phyllosticta citribraziliensis]|uniref:Secreted protein n=1 Tax=Phyllosticta citribraziliensis TaxID=989973 RepID=A0ABR1LMZ1_9PEZI
MTWLTCRFSAIASLLVKAIVYCKRLSLTFPHIFSTSAVAEHWQCILQICTKRTVQSGPFGIARAGSLCVPKHQTPVG